MYSNLWQFSFETDTAGRISHPLRSVHYYSTHFIPTHPGYTRRYPPPVMQRQLILFISAIQVVTFNILVHDRLGYYRRLCDIWWLYLFKCLFDAKYKVSVCVYIHNSGMMAWRLVISPSSSTPSGSYFSTLFWGGPLTVSHCSNQVCSPHSRDYIGMN